MNILSLIVAEIEQELNSLGLNFEDIKEFADSKSYRGKKNLANVIINKIFKSHGKDKVSNPLSKLALIEAGSVEFLDRLRDHVVHPLYCFFFGLYLHSKLGLSWNDGLYFQWKIASLLHDIAYPVEIAQGVASRYVVNDMCGVSENMPEQDKPTIYVTVDNVESWSNINYIEKLQNYYDRHAILINVNDEITHLKENKKVCHGVIGALLLLKIMHALHHENNWEFNSETSIDWREFNFYNNIVPACAAIFFHNLDKSRVQCVKLKYDDAEIVYLLRLVDNLQDWDRPGKNGEKISGNKFEVSCDGNNKILYYVPRKRIVNIKQQIECLEYEGMIDIAVK